MRCTHCRLFYIIWGGLEIALFGGIVFGWASLVLIFKVEGYFTTFCSNETIVNMSNDMRNSVSTNRSQLGMDCRKQDELFSLVFAIATCTCNILAVVNGWIMDKYGIRICRLMAIVFMSCSTLMVAFSSSDNSFMLFPSMAMLTYGGNLILLTNMQIANLVNTKRSTIIALYDGAYDSSAFVFLLIKIAYDNGVSIRTAFIALTLIFVIPTASTLFWIPKDIVPWPCPHNYKFHCLLEFCFSPPPPPDRTTPSPTAGAPVQVTHDAKNLVDGQQQRNTWRRRRGRVKSSPPVAIDEQWDVTIGMQAQFVGSRSCIPEFLSSTCPETEMAFTSFRQSLLSPLYIWTLVWTSFLRLVIFFFVGTFNPWLTHLAGKDEQQVSFYTSVFSTMQFFGVFTAPVSGLIMDKAMHGKKNPNDVDRIRACRVPFFLNSLFASVLLVLASLPMLKLQIATFIFHVVQRSFLFGPSGALIAHAFPSQHFGKLFGILMCVSAVVCLLQYPLFLLREYLASEPLHVNMIILAFVLITFGHPIYVTRYCRWREAIRSSPSPSAASEGRSSVESHLLLEKVTVV